MDTIIENKIESLLEEAWDDLRNRNMALRLQGMTPEEVASLQTTGGQLAQAGKSALGGAAAGALGGAAGGGIVGGGPGALIGAGIGGAGMGLGTGLGEYFNARSMGNMTPEQIKQHAAEAEKQYGMEYANSMRGK